MYKLITLLLKILHVSAYSSKNKSKILNYKFKFKKSRIYYNK